MLVTFWPLAADSGSFSTRGLAAGAAAFFVTEISFAVSTPPITQAAEAARAVLDRHPYAQFARWKQLCLAAAATDGSDPEPSGDAAGSLVAHEESNPLCPCPAPSCAGPIAGTSAVLQWAVLLLNLLGDAFVYGPLMFWTAVVSFGQQTWTSPWRAALAAYVLAANTCISCSMVLDSVAKDVALQGLQPRLESRAAVRALSAFLSRCSESAFKPVTWPAVEPYVEVHLALVPSWRALSGATTTTVTAIVSLMSFGILAMAITVLGSGCIPAYLLASTFGILAGLLLRFLASVAAASAGAVRTAALYSRARNELDLLLARVPGHPEAARLRANARVLAGFRAAAESERARVFGFPVDYGVLRGLLVTALTVGVGLYGILRGAGVWVTVQSACPIA